MQINSERNKFLIKESHLMMFILIIRIKNTAENNFHELISIKFENFRKFPESKFEYLKVHCLNIH